MKRHHVILGTRTTAGGEVITASSGRSLNGVAVALEGDKVHCPACKSTGVIRCHGPRLPDTCNGINVALEHDLCVCRCKTPPRLLAAQSFMFQTVAEGRSGADASAAHSHAHAAASAANSLSQASTQSAPAPAGPASEKPEAQIAQDIPDDDDRVIAWLRRAITDSKANGILAPSDVLMHYRNLGLDKRDNNLPAAERFAQVLNGDYGPAPVAAYIVSGKGILQSIRRKWPGTQKYIGRPGSKHPVFVEGWGLCGVHFKAKGMSLEQAVDEMEKIVHAHDPAQALAHW